MFPSRPRRVVEFSPKIEAIAVPDRSAFVSHIFYDNEGKREFNTIQAAIDFAYAEWGDSLSIDNKAVIFIAPGIYTEQIHSYVNIVITGHISGYDSIDTPPPATIYNTGADSATYPLRSNEDEVYDLIGINIKTAASGTLGKLPSGNFNNCRFTNGDFIERNSNVQAIFMDCIFYGSDNGGFNLTGVGLTGKRLIIFRGHCNIGLNVTPKFKSTHTVAAHLKCTDLDIEGTVDIEGDWNWETRNCYVYRQEKRSNIDTTGIIVIIDSIIANGLHFVSDPGGFIMSDSSFIDGTISKIPVGEADITADVTIIEADISGCTVRNGLSGKIQTLNPKKYVGTTALDSYITLQDAIDSTVTGGTIEISNDLTGLSELITTGTKKITIDGRNTWSLSFTSDIAEIGANQALTFSNIKGITGGVIEINGNAAELHLHSCVCPSTFGILITSGTDAKMHLNNTNLTGASGLSAVQVNSLSCTMKIEYSFIKGASGEPAIEFTVDADDKLKAKFSTIIHGDGGANDPLTYTYAGAGAVDVAIYNCGLNAAWDPSDFSNTIGSANNTTDAQIDF